MLRTDVQMEDRSTLEPIPSTKCILWTEGASETKQTEVLILKSLGLVFTSHSSLQVQADYSTSMNKNVGLKKKKCFKRK